MKQTLLLTLAACWLAACGNGATPPASTTDSTATATTTPAPAPAPDVATPPKGDYKVVMIYEFITSEEEIGDWTVYASDVTNYAKQKGIPVVSLEKGKSIAQIPDKSGKIIGSIDVSSCINGKQLGFVVSQNGKTLGCIDYDMDMVTPIKAYFGDK